MASSIQTWCATVAAARVWHVFKKMLSSEVFDGQPKQKVLAKCTTLGRRYGPRMTQLRLLVQAFL